MGVQPDSLWLVPHFSATRRPGGIVMKLTATAVTQARSRARQYKLYDGRGLFLLVHPNGSKYWRLKYRYGDREKQLSLGVYPDVSLKKAREKAQEARSFVADGIDPSAKRQAERQAVNDSFEAVSREWHGKYRSKWTDDHANRILRRLERDVFPWIGSFPVSTVSASDLLGVFRRIEGRGAIQTAHRAKQDCGQVFRYAIATGRAERDPTQDLKGALSPYRRQNFAAITDSREVGPLLRAIDSYRGQLVTRCALQLAPLLFVRPGELRAAEWVEFDLKGREWRIPATRMKMNVPHIVPLSRQALAVLNELQALTGRGRYLFPSLRTRNRPMSENTVNAALRRLGYTGKEMTGHGFRSMASTLLNEQGWNRDAIERQLAHCERSSSRAAYNYAEYLEERRRMMQAWACYLDGLKSGSVVVPIGVRA